MSETKFTKAPWTCCEVEFGDYQTGDVAFVIKSESDEIMVGSVANCALIKESPRMYEALEGLISVIPESIRPMIQGDIDFANEVLATARGDL